MLGSDPAWFDDVRVLTRRPAEFFPGKQHSEEERLNAIVRLTLYCALALTAFTLNTGYLVLGLVAVALASVSFRSGRSGRSTTTRPPTVGGVPVPHAQRARVECTTSTAQNPFANHLLGDDPARPPACAFDDHADEVRANFNRGLVRNEYDVYDRENSQRQFMTMPVTTSTPDTVAFANFCYGQAGKKTCKEDPSMCTGFRAGFG